MQFVILYLECRSKGTCRGIVNLSLLPELAIRAFGSVLCPDKLGSITGDLAVIWFLGIYGKWGIQMPETGKSIPVGIMHV